MAIHNHQGLIVILVINLKRIRKQWLVDYLLQREEVGSSSFLVYLLSFIRLLSDGNTFLRLKVMNTRCEGIIYGILVGSQKLRCKQIVEVQYQSPSQTSTVANPAKLLLLKNSVIALKSKFATTRVKNICNCKVLKNIQLNYK